MRKTVLLLFTLLTCTMMQAQGYIPKVRIDFGVQLNMGDIDDGPIGNPMPKSPANPPMVYIEGNVLFFDGDHSGYELTIRDDNGNAVYITTVTSTTATVILPSTLQGQYEIRLYSEESYYYYGYIVL